VQAERSAGSCNGAFSLDKCLAQGLAAGTEAAQSAGFGDGRASSTPPVTEEVAEGPLQTMWEIPSPSSNGHGPKRFVDLQTDVTTDDISIAAREGYESVEHLKRYTTAGMGTDQGKLGNVNVIGILANTTGADVASVGTTTFRPPYTPIIYGAIAGRDLDDLFDPIRKTALHEWHEEAGALFENVGQWKRAWYYPRPGESMHDAVERECEVVRSGVGILDASTLGKIDIKGPDVGKFLNRMYINGYAKLAIGRCRYGFMLDENGMVMDDGVTARLGQNHYLMHTTTSGAAHVMAWLERWLQTEWPDLKVYLTSATDHWATISLNGPLSRKVVARLCSDVDLSNDAFPFLSVREGTVAGVPARIFRVSFAGELSYEINVNAHYGRAVWEAAMAAGEGFGIAPYGTEAMHLLRAEKGYVIVGQDSDGSQTPADLGVGGMVSGRKDFLGKRSLSRKDTARTDRKQLVGLLTEEPSVVLPEGGQIVEEDASGSPMPMLGHVTSSYHSARLGRSIALGVVKDGHRRTGDAVYVPLADGRRIRAVISGTIFYDPEGERQNV
jgi:sarcosine oxidase subunit alpha